MSYFPDCKCRKCRAHFGGGDTEYESWFPIAQEPIPDRVYWAPLADNFYSADGHGQGVDFYRKWKPRRAEFPQGESFGWGKGSAHNPFKDAPRTPGVDLPDGGQR